jgi:hypothetical protein
MEKLEVRNRVVIGVDLLASIDEENLFYFPSTSFKDETKAMKSIYDIFNQILNDILTNTLAIASDWLNCV